MRLAEIERRLDAIPMCPSCEEMHDLVKDGVYRSMQRYICKKCGKRFKISKGE